VLNVEINTMRVIIEIGDHMSSFGSRLKELRLEKKLTQKELGERLKLSESAIGMYERGERLPPIDLIKKIASFFDVTRSYIIGDTNDRSSSSFAEIDEDLKVLMEDPDFMVAYKEYPGSPEEAKEDLIGFLKLIKERDERKKKK
jgi:transcriptional regulator with XRE-family HTH domain